MPSWIKGVILNITKLALAWATALALTLTGCSPKESPDKAVAAANSSNPLEAVSTQAKGFAVGAMMRANTVYVLFDPQCPHCGHLWEASVPLQKKIKFVWVPVAFISPKSAPQGAALLSAANPAQAMADHETSLLAGTGGMAASASVPADLEQTIKKNTELFNSLGVTSVPYIVAKNVRTGQVVTNNGAMATPALASFLGIDLP